MLWRRAHRKCRKKSASLMEKQDWGSLNRVTKGNEVWKSFQTNDNNGVEKTMIF